MFENRTRVVSHVPEPMLHRALMLAVLFLWQQAFYLFRSQISADACIYEAGILEKVLRVFDQVGEVLWRLLDSSGCRYQCGHLPGLQKGGEGIGVIALKPGVIAAVLGTR